MRKKMCFFAALCIACISLTGCHGRMKSGSFEMPDEFNEDEKTEITFWAKNDTNVKQVRIYEKAIEDFERIYPNIKVNMRLYTDYGRIYNDVITNIATGTTPNVCITYPDHIATYLSGDNIVADMDALAEDEKWGLGGSKVKFDSPKMEEMIPQFLEECKIGGKLYALPFMRSTEACYINKTYVEKLGFSIPEKLTWDFVREVSAAAVEKNEDGTYALNGQKVMIPFIYKSTDNMMIQMLRQTGADYSSKDGEVLIFNGDTKNILKNIAEDVEKETFSTFKISGYPANFLNAGQCVFAIDSTAGATWMGCRAPLSDISEDKLVDFETAVMPVPQYDTENPKMISQGPSVCIFNKDNTNEVFASWLFTMYLVSNDVQIAYSQTEGYVPVTEKAQRDEAYTDYLSGAGADNDLYYDVKIKASEMLLENTENTFVTPVFSGSASLRDAAGQMIETTVKSVRRGIKTDDAFFEKLFDDMTALYRLDQISKNIGGMKDAEGDIPATGIALLASLGGTWVLIVLYVTVTKIKMMIKSKNNLDI